MPWKEASRVNLRLEFVLSASVEGSNKRALAREFGISPTTAYKWLARHERGEGTLDQARRPLSSPTRVREEWRELIIKERTRHPAWGARKIHAVLLRSQGLPREETPSVPTVHRVIEQAGLVRHAPTALPVTRFEREHPNELWQMDFKGHVPLTTGERLHPLTILDDCTRFVTGVAALSGETEELVWPHLVRAFEENGLPEAVLCDNGSPWGAAEARFTTLGRRLLRLGVRVLHGRARHPQTQGKLERVNCTLNQELLSRQSFSSFWEAQVALEAWREQYNRVRPHEALGMLVPAEKYSVSARSLPQCLPPVTYEVDDVVRKVQDKGLISYGGREYRVGAAFKGERVALRRSGDPGVLSVFYCREEIARLTLEEE